MAEVRILFIKKSSQFLELVQHISLVQHFEIGTFNSPVAMSTALTYLKAGGRLTDKSLPGMVQLVFRLR